MYMYMDETLVNYHIASERLWVDIGGTGGWRRPNGKEAGLSFSMLVDLQSGYLGQILYFAQSYNCRTTTTQ